MTADPLVTPQEIKEWRKAACGTPCQQILVDVDAQRRLLIDAETGHSLFAEINNPHTASFIEGVKLEAAHQRDKWGQPAQRGKSAENWFWLVGYLAGKCLRAAITGDKEKARHHTISAAAACANWFEAIGKDTTGNGSGADLDIAPVEIARFERPEDPYSGR